MALKKCIFLFALFISSSAFSDVEDFSGASISLNLQTVNADAKASQNAGPFALPMGQQSWNESLQVGYGFVLSPKQVVTLGGNYSFGDNKIDLLGVATMGLKNQYSFYVEPGYLISEKTLAYGKISYESAKGYITSVAFPQTFRHFS